MDEWVDVRACVSLRAAEGEKGRGMNESLAHRYEEGARTTIRSKLGLQLWLTKRDTLPVCVASTVVRSTRSALCVLCVVCYVVGLCEDVSVTCTGNVSM